MKTNVVVKYGYCVVTCGLLLFAISVLVAMSSGDLSLFFAGKVIFISLIALGSVVIFVNILFEPTIAGFIDWLSNTLDAVDMQVTGGVVCPCCNGVEPMKMRFGDPMWRCPICKGKGVIPKREAEEFERRVQYGKGL